MDKKSIDDIIADRVKQDHLDTSFIPKKILSILYLLEEKGHSAYIVGGCVRDWFLGYDQSSFLAKGGDFDITTSATVDEMKEIFSNYKQILDGEEFGTIKLYHRGDIVEITTFRIEGAYRDGRHPDEVIFSDRIEDDLSRRDFTINAMAADSKGQIIDPFQGRNDLIARLVKTVGLPEERFTEDYLRMLRAVRFATTLGFEIESLTFDAIVKIQNSNIEFSEAVSSERKLSELQKTLDINPSKGLKLLYDTSLLGEVLPVKQVLTSNTVEQLQNYLNKSHGDWILSFAIILLGLNQDTDEITVNILENYLVSLACPTIVKDHIINLITQYPLPDQILTRVSSEINLLHFIWNCVSVYKQEKTYEGRFWSDMFFLHELFVDEINSSVEDTICNLWKKYPRASSIEIFVNGNDVIKAGYDGRAIGLIIEELRLYRPKNKDNARDFLSEFFTYPLNRDFIADQLSSKPSEEVTHVSMIRRKKILELNNYK